MYEFRTQIHSRDVDIYDLDHKFPKLKGLKNGSDYEIEPQPFYVSWCFELEVRDWGVKEMSYYATNVEGQFEVVFFDNDGDEQSREMVDLNFELFRDNLALEIEAGGRHISVDSIEIDYSDMSIHIC